jgi:hypothetical protein
MTQTILSGIQLSIDLSSSELLFTGMFIAQIERKTHAFLKEFTYEVHLDLISGIRLFVFTNLFIRYSLIDVVFVLCKIFDPTSRLEYARCHQDVIGKAVLEHSMWWIICKASLQSNTNHVHLKLRNLARFHVWKCFVLLIFCFHNEKFLVYGTGLNDNEKEMFVVFN